MFYQPSFKYIFKQNLSNSISRKISHFVHEIVLIIWIVDGQKHEITIMLAPNPSQAKDVDLAEGGPQRAYLAIVNM
jgi:hypothetical protein